MEDQFINLIRRFEDKKDIEWCFPNDHMGVADRLIYNNVLRKVAIKFRDHDPQGRKLLSRAYIWDVNAEMKTYGFKARDLEAIY